MTTETSKPMRGIVVQVPSAGVPGLIAANGHQWPFALEGVWGSPVAPAPNQTVEFTADALGTVTRVVVGGGAQRVAAEKLRQATSAAAEWAQGPGREKLQQATAVAGDWVSGPGHEALQRAGKGVRTAAKVGRRMLSSSWYARYGRLWAWCLAAAIAWWFVKAGAFDKTSPSTDNAGLHVTVLVLLFSALLFVVAGRRTTVFDESVRSVGSGWWGGWRIPVPLSFRNGVRVGGTYIWGLMVSFRMSDALSDALDDDESAAAFGWMGLMRWPLCVRVDGQVVREGPLMLVVGTAIHFVYLVLTAIVVGVAAMWIHFGNKPVYAISEYENHQFTDAILPFIVASLFLYGSATAVANLVIWVRGTGKASA